jgi:hypothetical protein
MRIQDRLGILFMLAAIFSYMTMSKGPETGQEFGKFIIMLFLFGAGMAILLSGKEN